MNNPENAYIYPLGALNIYSCTWLHIRSSMKRVEDSHLEILLRIGSFLLTFSTSNLSIHLADQFLGKECPGHSRSREQ